MRQGTTSSPHTTNCLHRSQTSVYDFLPETLRRGPAYLEYDTVTSSLGVSVKDHALQGTGDWRVGVGDGVGGGLVRKVAIPDHTPTFPGPCQHSRPIYVQNLAANLNWIQALYKCLTCYVIYVMLCYNMNML